MSRNLRQVKGASPPTQVATAANKEDPLTLASLVKIPSVSGQRTCAPLGRLQREDIKFSGNWILFFPDMNASLAKQRVEFKDIKAKLYVAGITLSLRYPARLCVTVNGNKHLFDTPTAAEGFYEQIKGDSPTRDEEQH